MILLTFVHKEANHDKTCQEMFLDGDNLPGCISGVHDGMLVGEQRIQLPQILGTKE